jgi:hypothetical protein
MLDGLYLNYSYVTDNIPEKEKLSKEYLLSNVNKHIFDLYTGDKVFERKCFDFAAGIRNTTEMSYLTDNYGVSNPVDVPFVPIMRKRINHLVNKALQNNLDYIVTCQNEQALDYKLQQKKIGILNELSGILQSRLQENIKLLNQGKIQKDVVVEEVIKELKEKYNDTWSSDIEIAAYNYTKYYTDRYDLKHKFNNAFNNFIVAGQPYYRNYISELGKDPIFEIVHPEELYVDRYDTEFWIEDHKRIVRCKYMTVSNVIAELGHLMTDEEKVQVQKLFLNASHPFPNEKQPYIVNQDTATVMNYNDYSYNSSTHLVRVFHVEWIATNPVEYDTKNMDLVDSKINELRKVRERKDRYEGWKIDIGSGIYLGCGKTKYVSRTLMNPFDCKLSYNGFRYRLRNGEPYSIVYKSRDIQNMYDLTYFQLSSLFASIIPGGPIVVEESIPKSYGNTPEERYKKVLGYRKLGHGMLVSLFQEGNELLGGFNNWGASIPSNVDGALIQALQAQLEILEQQLDNMMGITRQSLGEMEERDGKSTTMMAVSQSEIVNKDLYFLNGMFIKKALTSIVNLSRITNKEGFIGSYVLGLDHKIFSLDAETFSMADYNIFISDDFEDVEKLKLADDMVMKAMEGQLLDLRKAFNVLMEKSISKKKRAIDKIGAEQEKANMQNMQQMQQQIEEMTKQMEALQKENEKLKQSGSQLQEKEISIKQSELELKKEMEGRRITLEELKQAQKNEIDLKEVQIEAYQITDSNPYNNKVRKV